jgi:hypothetical protein
MLLYYMIFLLLGASTAEERWMIVSYNEDQIVFSRTDLFNTGEAVELISYRETEGLELSRLRADCVDSKIMRINSGESTAAQQFWREVEPWEQNRLGVMCQSIPVERYSTFQGLELLENYSHNWWNIPNNKIEKEMIIHSNGSSYFSNPLDRGLGVSWIAVVQEDGSGFSLLLYADCANRKISVMASTGPNVFGLIDTNDINVNSGIPVLFDAIDDVSLPREVYTWLCYSE